MATMEQNLQLTSEHLEQLKAFSLDEKYTQELPDIVVLILESKSLETDEEKQNWFNLLPLMTGEQIEKLR
jgi:hypothetical protein